MKINTSMIPWLSFRLATTEYIPGSINNEVLIMHGAGEADQTRTANLAKALAEHNCRVIAFDFVGHGLSTGNISDLTLANRAEQALAVYNHYGLGRRSILVGFSMSGQTAIDLMSLLDGQVDCIALFAPAIYDKAAQNTHFGPDFSTLLRKEESWRNTDACEKLKIFHGKLLTFESPNDTVIPVTVIDLLHQSAFNTTTELRVRVKNAPHTFAHWTSQSTQRSSWFADSLLRVVNSNTLLDTDLARQADIKFEIV